LDWLELMSLRQRCPEYHTGILVSDSINTVPQSLWTPLCKHLPDQFLKYTIHEAINQHQVWLDICWTGTSNNHSKTRHIKRCLLLWQDLSTSGCPVTRDANKALLRHRKPRP
jgi:hypothetical protein